VNGQSHAKNGTGDRPAMDAAQQLERALRIERILEFAEEQRELKRQALASGSPMLNADEISEEVQGRRGGGGWEH